MLKALFSLPIPRLHVLPWGYEYEQADYKQREFVRTRILHHVPPAPLSGCTLSDHPPVTGSEPDGFHVRVDMGCQGIFVVEVENMRVITAEEPRIVYRWVARPCWRSSL